MDILIALLALSLALNGFLSFKFLQSKKNPVHTYDAKQLLHDLTVNSALVRVTRIDPESVFLRSPR